MLTMRTRRPWNCAWTHAQITGKDTPVSDSPPPHALLNSGLVVLEPSPALLEDMVHYLYTEPVVKTFSFPDQDFITKYFEGKWRNIGWTYNAIKTARYWHPKLWKDAEIHNLHYIVAKPWMTPREKWTAHEGDDRITHGWWWYLWQQYRKEAAKDVIVECEKHMLGEGVDVGAVESWEESVEAEKAGRARDDPWPPGKPWGVTVDGVEY
jgi:inositol 3-alpha-galactosyltransferase